MMVMCTMESVMIPRPPLPPGGPPAPPMPPPFLPPKPKTTEEERRFTEKLVQITKVSRNASVRSKLSMVSQQSNGFRLREDDKGNIDETGSVYSVYKQKIDSMFESDSSASQKSRNSVQAKIDKMFSDVAKDNGIPMNEIGVHTFSVDYLGSVPLQDKVTSLSGLQNPLKELYFSYKKSTKSRKALTGRLEISEKGLKVQYQGESGDLEQMNSFPTIAVWSAVKFVINDNCTYAFLPLITDPDNIDKQQLFKSLNITEKGFICNETHSPLFAVVMRKMGIQKQLECHGFVCQTSEDAIVIAATLYKSLVSHMKNKEKRLNNKNGLTTCTSITSSHAPENGQNNAPVRPPRKKRSTASSIISEKSDGINTSDTQPLISLESKGVRRSTKTKRAPRAPTEDLDAILPYEEPSEVKKEDKKDSEEEKEATKPKSFTDKLNFYMSREQKQLTEEIKHVICDENKGLKKVQRNNKLEGTLRKKENSGDILTKVTIPRSGSFLNAGGLTRYKNKVSRNNEAATNGSPLGFKEIFNELSLQEGLHSLDDILSVIIDPDGMSFNDLKPIYKEFLLKLSLTLTKDELYARSKSIMRRQKKKEVLARSPSNNARKTHHVIVGNKFKRIKHIFQKKLKIKACKKAQRLRESQSSNENNNIPLNADGKLPESSISTSSYDTRHFRSRDEVNSQGKKQSYRKKGGVTKYRRKERASTSEESDFLSLKRHRTKSQLSLLNTQNRNSSSGYVSCSECSYDSDSCTCVSADKCYCSLGQRNFSKRGNKERCCCHVEDLTFCECDTDSCAESNKCYCQVPSMRGSMQPTFFPDPLTINNPHHHKKLCKSTSNTKSTRSLEYMSNPSESYYEKLKMRSKFGSERCAPRTNTGKKRRNSHIGVPYQQDLGHFNRPPPPNFKMSPLDCDLFQMAERNSFKDIQNIQMMYARSNTNSSCQRRNRSCPNRPQCPNERRALANFGGKGPLKSTAIAAGGCTEAISIKKSAEIAALFADFKLSQTTDITHLMPHGFSTPEGYIINSSKQHSKKNKSRSDSKHMGKNNMYSTKNGLYTIQSQSDESRRSSLSGDNKKIRRNKMNKEKDYFDLNISNNNIEDSLGYLP